MCPGQKSGGAGQGVGGHRERFLGVVATFGVSFLMCSADVLTPSRQGMKMEWKGEIGASQPFEEKEDVPTC